MTRFYVSIIPRLPWRVRPGGQGQQLISAAEANPSPRSEPRALFQPARRRPVVAIIRATISNVNFYNTIVNHISIMKLTGISLLALSASVIHARFIERHETDQVILNGAANEAELYLIELAPGETMMVTEEEKWELRRVNPV